MANPLTVLPDTALALIQYLRLRPEVTALLPAGNILTAIPSAATYPYVLVTPAGGIGIWPALDDASLQVDTVGGTQASCSLIARTVRAAVWAIANDTVPAGVLVSGAEELGPQWIPDTIPVVPLARYVARYRIILHP